TELVGPHLAGPGALREVGDAPRQPGEVEVARVPDDGHQQAAGRVDGDPDVLRVVVGDGAGLRVDGGVHRRVRLERLDGGQGAARLAWAAKAGAGGALGSRAGGGGSGWAAALGAVSAEVSAS